MKRTTKAAEKHAEQHAKKLDLMYQRMKQVPEDALPYLIKEADLVVFEYVTSRGRPAATAFHGRAVKPIINEAYRSEADRAERIRQIRANYERKATEKAEIKQASKSGSGFKVGDILYASWGYDQTNVDWYVVTAVSGTMITIREIGSKVVREYRGGEEVEPDPSRIVGEPIRRRPYRYGTKPDQVSVRVDDVRSARLWEGRPMHQTAYGWGH